MDTPKLHILTKWFSYGFLTWSRTFGLFLLAFTVLAVAFGYTFTYILPFLVGLVLAKTAQPLIGWIQRKIHLSRGKTSALVALLMLLTVFGLIGLAGYLVGRELVALIQRILEIDPIRVMKTIEIWADDNGIVLPNLNMAVWNSVRDDILTFLTAGQSWAGMVGSGLLALLSSLPIAITLVVAIVFSTYYFARDYLHMKGNMVFLFSDYANQAITKTWLGGMAMLGRYVRSYLLIYLLTGIESFVVFLVLGIPFALAWAVLVAFVDILPVLGPGMIYLPMTAYYLFIGDTRTAVFLGIGWLVVMVARQVIEPRIVAVSIEIHPLSMLAILLVGFQTGSVAVMLYLTVLLITYNLLKSVHLLQPLFPVEPKKKKGLLHRKDRIRS